jgi:hypothetical protein
MAAPISFQPIEMPTDMRGFRGRIGAPDRLLEGAACLVMPVELEQQAAAQAVKLEIAG